MMEQMRQLGGRNSIATIMDGREDRGERLWPPIYNTVTTTAGLFSL